jgi:hypothetical protein
MSRARPIEERIAELFGRTGFRDIRDGAARSSYRSLTTADVAAQLGFMQHENGLPMLLAMETHWASTLVHERTLLSIWAGMQRAGKVNADYPSTVLSRLGCALAIRQCAGAQFAPRDVAFYAFLINRRHGHLAYSMRLADCWLGGLWQTGLSELRRRFSAAA